MSDSVPSQQLSDLIASDAVISVTFPVNDDVIRRAVKAGMRVTWGNYGPSLCSGMGVFLLIMVGFALFVGKPSAPLVFMGLFSAYVAAIPYIAFQKALRVSRRFFQRCEVTGMSCTFGPEFYEVRHAAGTAQYKYATATKLVLLSDLILVLIHKSAWFLPKSCLTSEQTTLVLSRFKNAGSKVEVR